MVVRVYALIYTFSSYRPNQNMQFCQRKQNKGHKFHPKNLNKIKDINFTLKTVMK
jgi:hypothetical protein